VGLLQMASGGQWRAAVEDADIVEPEKPAFEEASAKPILAVHPPAEIRRQPAKDPLEKIEVRSAAQRVLNAVEKDRPPGLYRRVDIAEVPLIGRDLSGGMQVDLAEQQVELLFGEIYVDSRQGKRMKREVPGGEPRIFPLVRHRDDMIADHVEPLAVAHLPGRRPHRIVAVFLEPF